jgi:hypothetical protein
VVRKIQVPVDHVARSFAASRHTHPTGGADFDAALLDAAALLRTAVTLKQFTAHV